MEPPRIASKIPDKISKSVQNLNREVHIPLARSSNKERRKALSGREKRAR
jgi:hypothetical protein